MEKITKRIVDSSTWAASSDLASLNLPREGLITEIKIRAAITMSAALTAVQPNGLWNVIQNLKVEGDGGRTYVGLSGELTGRILALLNLYDFKCPMITLQDGTAEHLTFVIHPGSNPKDPFDLSAAIPARALSTLQAKITTTANSVVDDTTTISSGAYYFEVNEVLDVPVSPGLMTPLGATLSWAHDANHSDYSKEIDIPTGAWLRRIVILVQDETATRPVRKDDEVTGVKLRLTKVARAIIESKWEDLKVNAAMHYGVMGAPFQVADTVSGHMNVPDGFAIIDLRHYFHPVYGANLTNYSPGDIKLGLTIENYAAGDDTLIYWDQLQPVEPQYIGK